MDLGYGNPHQTPNLGQRMDPMVIAPSVLTANLAALAEDCQEAIDAGLHWMHLDVMDGVFVPNISFGMPVMQAIAGHAKKPLDVHLMIVDPDR